MQPIEYPKTPTGLQAILRIVAGDWGESTVRHGQSMQFATEISENTEGGREEFANRIQAAMPASPAENLFGEFWGGKAKTGAPWQRRSGRS